MSGWPGLGVWALAGLAWWLFALGTALPYRWRHRPWVVPARLSLGLPLALAAWLEAGRSRWGLSRGVPVLPYRGFVPLWLALVVAEAIALAVGSLVAILCML